MSADTPDTVCDEQREREAWAALASELTELGCSSPAVDAILVREGALSTVIIAAEDAVAAMLAFAATERTQARREALEEAARVADTCEISGPLAPGWADGASSASSQIAAAIRAKAGAA